MNANASWDIRPGGASKQANAKWDIPPSGDASRSAAKASLFTGKDKNTLLAMFKMAQSQQQQHGSSSIMKGNKLSGAMSTSALSNMVKFRPSETNNNSGGMQVRSKACFVDPSPPSPVHVGEDPFGSPDASSLMKKSRKMEGTKLRRETLMSLGLDVKKPGIAGLRSSMKKGKGMQRATTLGNMREIDVILPDGRPLKKNASITFKDMVEIKRIPSISSLANDKSELWFQSHEEREIRQTAKALVKIVDESNVDPSLLELHGLEGHTRAHKKIAQARKFNTWDAVLDAQDFIRHSGGKYDDEEIASMVRSLSQQSVYEAQMRARQYTVSS